MKERKVIIGRKREEARLGVVHREKREREEKGSWTKEERGRKERIGGSEGKKGDHWKEKEGKVRRRP